MVGEKTDQGVGKSLEMQRNEEWLSYGLLFVSLPHFLFSGCIKIVEPTPTQSKARNLGVIDTQLFLIPPQPCPTSLRTPPFCCISCPLQ